MNRNGEIVKFNKMGFFSAQTKTQACYCNFGFVFLPVVTYFLIPLTETVAPFILFPFVSLTTPLTPLWTCPESKSTITTKIPSQPSIFVLDWANVAPPNRQILFFGHLQTQENWAELLYSFSILGRAQPLRGICHSQAPLWSPYS